MDIGFLVVLAVLVAVVALAVRSIYKDKKAGRNISCGDCKACSGEDGACPSERWVVDLARDLEESSRERRH